MMRTIISLTVTAVLFAITSNVAEAAKINPSPIKKPPVVKFDWDKMGPGISKAEEKCDKSYAYCLNEIRKAKKRQKFQLPNQALYYRRSQYRCTQSLKECIDKAGGQQ